MPGQSTTKDRATWLFPSLHGLFLWLINGVDPNHLLRDGMILHSYRSYRSLEVLSELLNLTSPAEEVISHQKSDPMIAGVGCICPM